MKTSAKILSTQLLALQLCAGVAFAQTSEQQAAPGQTIELGPVDSATGQPMPVQQATDQAAQAHQDFTQQELDQMLAPIALYPDSLLSQILMASTYPLEVVQAARWSRANPGLSGDAAVKEVEQQNWDPSVKSLVAFPQVVSMMDEKLDWMERLGDAFLAQQQQVSDTVQGLRQKAQAAGNLQSNQNVRVEPQGQTIIIEQANPQVVYVPYYDPTFVYGSWWYPAYQPVYWRPWPGYYARPGYGAGFYWGSGITIGAGFFFGGFDWPHHHVTVVNVNNYYYRPPVHPIGPPGGGWQHDPVHRRGVPYRNPVVRQEFARPGGGSPDMRRDFRGNPPRMQGPTAVPNARPDGRDRSDNRSEWRDRERSRADNYPRPNVTGARPNIPDRGPNVSEPRNISRPNTGNAPARPNVPDGAGLVSRNIQQSNAGGAVPRSNPPNLAAPQLARPVARAPSAAPRPHVFEGVGQGPIVRESSQRGNSSAHGMMPGQPAAQQQRAAPAARPAAPEWRSGGGQGNEGPGRSQR